MKTKLVIFVLIVIFSSCKENYYKFKFNNYADCELTVTTDVQTVTIDPLRCEIVSASTKDYNSFSYTFKDTDLKIKLEYLGTHPTREINVSCYTHDFVVTVGGQSDSVIITINGKSYTEELPFYYGSNDNSIKSYEIVSRPFGGSGYTYTKVKVNDLIIDRFEHYNNSVGTLSGNIIY